MSNKTMSYVGKTLLRNHIRHTDTHNRMLEESDMWRHHRDRPGTSPGRVRSKCAEMPHAHMDRREDTQRQEFQGREEPSGSTYWVRQLYKAEEQNPDRWGHGGYKELYPNEFDSDRSLESDEERKKHKKKAKRKEKKEKKHKKKHKKKEKRSSPEKRHRKRRSGQHPDDSDEHSTRKIKSERDKPLTDAWVEKSSTSSRLNGQMYKGDDGNSDILEKTGSHSNKDISSRTGGSSRHGTRNFRSNRKREASESSDSSSRERHRKKRQTFDGKSRHKRRRYSSSDSSSDDGNSK